MRSIQEAIPICGLMLALIACFSLAPAPAGSASASMDRKDRGTHANSVAQAPQSAQRLVDLINSERAQSGLKPIRINHSLGLAAADHVADLIGHESCSHFGSDGSSPEERVIAAGYERPAGELLACGTDSPDATLQFWLAQSLNMDLVRCAACTDIGASHASSESGYRHYWVVELGDAQPPRAPECVCDDARGHVPPAVVADALANPYSYYGWQYPLNPGVPASPANPPRECLTLTRPGLSYHPVWNKPQWRVGCP